MNQYSESKISSRTTIYLCFSFTSDDLLPIARNKKQSYSLESWFRVRPSLTLLGFRKKINWLKSEIRQRSADGKTQDLPTCSTPGPYGRPGSGWPYNVRIIPGVLARRRNPTVSAAVNGIRRTRGVDIVVMIYDDVVVYARAVPVVRATSWCHYRRNYCLSPFT